MAGRPGFRKLTVKAVVDALKETHGLKTAAADRLAVDYVTF
jgi:hypothetical protein